MAWWKAAVVVGGVFATAACGSDDEGGGAGGAGGTGGAGGGGNVAASIWVDPADLAAFSEGTFFDHPWPSDRRIEGGHVRFTGYPNPRLQPLIGDFIESMGDLLNGFSPVAAGFLRFTAALDPATLPADPLAALEPTATVQLVDIDPASPAVGSRQRITLFFRQAAGVYWAENTLAFMPTLGFPLLPSTRYALVVTRGVRTADGRQVVPSPDLQAELDAGASGPLGDALGALDTAGVAAADIVHLSVFTTNDPTGEVATIADWVKDSYPAPTVEPASWSTASGGVTGVMSVYEGTYGPSPDFQRGSIPFLRYGDGGALAFDASGVPELQREFSLRFTLTVPDAAACPMPTAGYPIVLYAHGTGGNYRSLLGAGDEAESLARECIAAMGIDQIFHGTRPGGDCSLIDPPCNSNVELAFFNVSNPTAARANGPQSAIDVVQQARLFTESATVLPASVAAGGQDVRFDATRVMFFGHSQGGLNGPMFLAVDDAARGGVLSGSGSMISITLLEKTKPVNIAGLTKTLIGITNVEEQLSEDITFLHPAISLAQTIVDPSDPIHYAPLIATRPRPGFAAKSVLMTEGVNPDFTGDNYTPPHAIEVQAVAMGLPPQTPVIHTIEELQWTSLTPVTIPAGGLQGNLAGGQASGVLAQWPASQASDGHFVIYDIPEAMAQCAGFCANLAADPLGRVPAP